MIILDTNVLSELFRVQPNAGVVEWLGQQSRRSVFTTTITQGEILYGILALPEGRQYQYRDTHFISGYFRLCVWSG